MGKKDKKTDSGVTYICPDCGYKEEIPWDILEKFDQMFPEKLLEGPHQFYCDNCHGIMEPEEWECKITGYGLYEGLNKTMEINKESRHKGKSKNSASSKVGNWWNKKGTKM